MRRCLVDPFTQDGQISIERTIVEGTQFNLHHLSGVRDGAGKLKNGEQTFPGGLRMGAASFFARPEGLWAEDC
ncbi:hypothetical protein KSB_59370 [Ktedonobacter robiniae]|uniref:Uncharacterized protein n=1 Tax=Ktedonobacter robiniae TaxID=2778365 RepID=A0ABQ3UYM9_9CHLR|nr:hypothetical protein KSB_59370 [Ktedonobacter robiniae]